MTDEQAFLEAILDDPEDDNLRLIYADFLEERGDGARAEFIRVQVELSQVKRCKKSTRLFPDNHCLPPYCLHCRPHKKPAYYRDLRRRDVELLTAKHPSGVTNNLAWAEPLLVRVPAANWTDTTRRQEPFLRFRRGFVEEIGFPCRVFLEHAALFFGQAPITKVVLTDLEPHEQITSLGHRRVGWWWRRSTWERHDEPGEVLYQLLDAKEEIGWKWWDSREEALNALSAACVQHGRNLRQSLASGAILPLS